MCGNRAHRYMLARGRGTIHPAAAKASTNASRRARNTATSRRTRASGNSSAAIPIRWIPRYWLKSIGAFTASSAASASRFPKANPSRNPARW